VIEDIESFCAELRLHAFGDPGVFQQGHIKIVETRPAKVPSHGVSHVPGWFLLEVTWIEIRLPRRIARILVYK
jgi:hypothetical protein